MLQEAVLPRETVMYLFPNLPALVEEHGVLNTQMKKDKKTSHVIHNVGNLLLQRVSHLKTMIKPIVFGGLERLSFQLSFPPAD